MKTTTSVLAILSVLTLPFTLSVQGQANRLQDEYIVTLQPGQNPNGVALNHGLAPRHIYTKVLNGFAAKIPPGILRQLQNDARVAAIVPDQEIWAIGKPGGGGGGTTPTPQVVAEGIKRISATPGVNSQTGAGVGVAVVDTGLDFNHKDLSVQAQSFTAYTSAQDDNGHGTHAGGIIAALNNTIDVVGVAPGATLYAVKVLDAQGSGSDSAVIAGLDWVAQNGGACKPAIKVINMSLGRAASANDSLMHDAVAAVVGAGITVVVAAGNDSTKEVKDMVPAGFPEVIAVGSTTAKTGTSARRFPIIAADTASYFTTDGAYNLSTYIGVAISAPGEDQENISVAGMISSVGILSTKLGGGTTRMSGTSMAAPHVAGVVALICEKDSTLTPDAIKIKIMKGGVSINTAPLNSPTSGYTFDGDREGILNAPGALAP